MDVRSNDAESGAEIVIYRNQILEFTVLRPDDDGDDDAYFG